MAKERELDGSDRSLLLAGMKMLKSFSPLVRLALASRIKSLLKSLKS